MIAILAASGRASQRIATADAAAVRSAPNCVPHITDRNRPSVFESTTSADIARGSPGGAGRLLLDTILAPRIWRLSR